MPESRSTTIRVLSVQGSPVKIWLGDVDLTPHVLADPRPVIMMAPAGEEGTSTVTVTLVGDLHAEIDGLVIGEVSEADNE